MIQHTCAGLMLAALIAPLQPGQEQEKPTAKIAEAVHTRLSQGFTTEGFDPNTPFRDAVGFISERSRLTILIDTEAFKDELNISEPEAMPVKLPKMVDVPLREVLRLTCDQVHGAIAQQGMIIWVVPKSRVLPRLLKQEVDVTFEKRPLDDALRELISRTGFSVVLDENRAGERAKAPVTAKLWGVGLESAVRILADQAELKTVVVDKVLYVTTPEHAEALREENERRLETQPKNQKDSSKEQEKPEKATPKKDEKSKAK
jgi:hypothetical protein